MIKKALSILSFLFLFHVAHPGGSRNIYCPVAPESVKKFWGTNEAELSPAEWRASWIWRKGENQGTDLLLISRRQFDLEAKPDQARIYITADNCYELYVNGNLINRGPARCQPVNQSFDILDIAAVLEPGKNVLAVRVLHEGKFPSFNTPPRPGFMAQLEIRIKDKLETIVTDSSWKVKKPEGINLAMQPFGESVDFRREERKWQETDFDDSGWTDAEELVSDKFWPWPQPSRNSRAKTLTYPWLNLIPRDIPYLTQSLVRAISIYESGEIVELSYNDPVAEGAKGLLFPDPKKQVKGFEEYSGGTGPIVIQNRYPTDLYSNEAINSTYLIFDLGKIEHGYPHVEIEGAPGAIIEMLYAPHLIRQRFPLRTDISGRALTDRIILGKGKSVWTSLERKYMRYLLIAVRNTDKPVNLYFAGIDRCDYPFENNGSFSVADNDINWLWNAAVNTTRAVTTDAFTDNYRESLQYSQTSYYAARASYAAFGDRFLQRRYLEQIALSQQSDGMMPASAPVTAYRGQRFLDGPLFWLMGLHDYFLYSGDTLFTLKQLPAATRFLDRMQSWENKDRIIDSPPYPFWIDHADIERAGANFSLNALYLLAMKDMMWLMRSTGMTKEADEYAERINRLQNIMQQLFWDPEKKLFGDALIDGQLTPKYCEHSNSLAIVAGIASKEQQEAIIREFTDNNAQRLVHSDLFMHYPIEALFMSGRGTEALAMLKDRYLHMRAGGETLWEDWGLTVTRRTGRFEPTGGNCIIQGENTFIAHSLSRWLLGIQPTKPGMSEVIIACDLCGLSEIKGAVPTPSGSIAASWKVNKKNKSLEIEIPEGITAYLDSKSLSSIKNSITIDGKQLIFEAEKKILIPPGKHLVVF